MKQRRLKIFFLIIVKFTKIMIKSLYNMTKNMYYMYMYIYTPNSVQTP